MAFSSRSILPGHGSTGSRSSSSGKSPMLLAKIDEKKAELDNLKQLKDLSASLADQMQLLEEKLATLSEGTEVVATVLGNWHNVLQAINMASAKISNLSVNENSEESLEPDIALPLPQTLVRIPTENAEKLQQSITEMEKGI
ncbi:hypothetical protein K3495_g1772 [Podosphaera aphanis]|nr:hypothetical protein K3495_g1772 [Podosphaera aphanis]